MRRWIIYFMLVIAVLAIATLTQPEPQEPAYPPGREPMQLPENYRERFVQYATVDRSDAVSRNIYISPDALEDYTPGEPLPDGTMIVIEAFDAQRDDQGRVVTDDQGRLVQGELDPEIHMAEKRSTWRIEDLAATTNMGGWNFGAFDYDSGAAITGDLNDCFSCHDGGFRTDFRFTVPELNTFVRTGDVQYMYCPRPGRQRCR